VHRVRQDPSQAGKSQAAHSSSSAALDGFTASPTSESGDKLTRFGPISRRAVPAMRSSGAPPEIGSLRNSLHQVNSLSRPEGDPLACLDIA
jgi:hypothetical protein